MAGLNVAVGSCNPVKVEAVRRAFAAAFPDSEVTVSKHDVPSGVSDQPRGEEETRLGAQQRARGALAAAAAADYGVGLEGGVVDAASGGLESIGCMAIVRGRDGRESVSRTASFPLPPRVARLVRGEEPGYGKMELGAADDVVFNDIGSKQKGGAVAKVTNGLLDRARYYEHALLCACAPFLHDDTGLYDDIVEAPAAKKARKEEAPRAEAEASNLKEPLGLRN